ncbi:MAG: hypothetical protein JRG84_12990 [Deltaproteobacteria bacterium]|nr:hypothetical protein [Deltaproteobacteria bacterium]
MRYLFLAGLLLGFAAPAAVASPPAEMQLAGYETSETTNLTLTSPDAGMTLTWPLAGGVGGVPSATEGSSVLELDWTGETDRKVEVRHDWSGPTFDLAGYGGLLVDVYVETPSALPQIMGVWDAVFGWLEGFGLPQSTGQWVTVSMCVYDKEQVGLDRLAALVFEDLAGDDGVLYLDNLRLVPPRQLSFAGYDWSVKCGAPLGPGPNPFSQSEDHVWVDGSGRLHLTIVHYRNLWWSTEIVANDSLGHGKYVFSVLSRVDALDPNMILGLFTWDGDAPEHAYREIDFEFNPALAGVLGCDCLPGNGQYAIQPIAAGVCPGTSCAENLHRLDIDYSGASETTTHEMTWRADAIHFRSSYGDFPAPAANTIETWSYSGADNPPPGGETVRMNLWLANGMAPVGDQGAEVVLSDFRYFPPGSALPSLGRRGRAGLVLLLLAASALALSWRRTARTP